MITNTGIRCVLFAALLAAGGLGCASIPDLDMDNTDGSRTNPDAGKTVAGKPADSKNSDGSSKADTTMPEPDQASSDQRSYGHEFLMESVPGDRVLASVDDRQIMTSDMYEFFFLEKPMWTRDVLENLVLKALVRKEAARQGIRVKSEDVDQLLMELLENQRGMIAMNIDENLSLEEYVSSWYGMDMDSYHDLLRHTAVFHLLLKRCVRLGELQVRRLKLGIIIVKDLDKAMDIRKKLLNGASFKVLARENSIDPSRAIGGVLPPLPADMDYMIVKEGLKLGVGEVSEVDDATLGKEKVYRVIKLIEIVEPVRGSYKELGEDVEASLVEQPVVIPDVVRYWRESLEGRYDVKYHLP